MKKDYTKKKKEKNVILGRHNKNFSKIENVFLMIVDKNYGNFGCKIFTYFSAQKMCHIIISVQGHCNFHISVFFKIEFKKNR